MAHDAGECACDADWTPAAVYKLRATERERWQPVDSAPHRGRVLLFKDGKQYVGERCTNIDTGAVGWSIGELGDQRVILEAPTRWRELPEPPK